MFALVLSLLVSISAGAKVDAQDAFKKFCASFCGSGGYATCDIGSGKIALDHISTDMTASPFFEIGLDWNVSATIPARDVDRNPSGGANCDEKDGNTCQQYGHDWGWCNYPQHKCMTKYCTTGDFKYSNIKTEKEPGVTGFVFTHWVDNDSPHEQSSTISFDEATSAEAGLTLTDQVEVGSEVSIEASIPDILKTTFKESFKMTTASTHEHKLTKTQHWQISQPVKVGAKKTAKVELIITKVKVDGDWSGHVRFPNDAKLWCNKKVNGHNEWFVPASEFLPKYHSHLCHDDICYVKAKFSGFHGIDSQVKITECELYSRSCGTSRRRRSKYNLGNTTEEMRDDVEFLVV